MSTPTSHGTSVMDVLLTIVRVIVPSLHLLDIAVCIKVDISFRHRLVLVIVIQLYVLHLEYAALRCLSHPRAKRKMRCYARCKDGGQKRRRVEVACRDQATCGRGCNVERSCQNEGSVPAWLKGDRPFPLPCELCHAHSQTCHDFTLRECACQ